MDGRRLPNRSDQHLCSIGLPPSRRRRLEFSTRARFGSWEIPKCSLQLSAIEEYVRVVWTQVKLATAGSFGLIQVTSR